MELIQKFADLLIKAPDWVFLFCVPALILLEAVGFIFAPKRRWYFLAASVPVSAGFLLAYAKSAPLAVFYLGAVLVFSALCTLLFLIPRPKKREKREKKSREERLLEKFREELSEKGSLRPAMPPKVCCFEEDSGAGATAGEYGMSLSYAVSLLEKLRSKKLAAGDRLQTEELHRRLDYYREKPLTEGERNSLNDCLASILKLTAKYQL